MTTKTTQHTPGPWTSQQLETPRDPYDIPNCSCHHQRRTHDEFGCMFTTCPCTHTEARIEVLSAEGHLTHIAYVGSNPLGTEAEANARLIAAAPDLLEALKACYESLNFHGFTQLQDRVEAAIERAEA